MDLVIAMETIDVATAMEEEGRSKSHKFHLKHLHM